MSLFQKIQDDVKVAMKAREKEKVSVLRMILSELKYELAKMEAAELTDDQTIKICSTYYKRLDKSLADFPLEEQQNKIKAEMLIVESYLPKKASEEEVATYVEQMLASSDEKNFGILMKGVMAHFGKAADGKTISKVLKAKMD